MAITLCVLLDFVQQDCFSRSSKTQKNLRLVVSTPKDPLKSNFGVGDYFVSAGQLGG